MLTFLIVLIAAIFVFLAFQLRHRLRELEFLSWTGWVLVGAGVPVLTGQLVSLALLSQNSESLASWAAIALAMGLGGGLAWVSACLSIRFTKPRNRWPKPDE
jgi:multisubunit Na+/H+ antiporter MnhB subunit